MMKQRKLNLPILLCALVILAGCTNTEKLTMGKSETDAPPEYYRAITHSVEVLSWSYENSTVVLCSNVDVSLDDYVIRQGLTKTIESLKGVRLKAGEVMTVIVSKKLLNKTSNELILIDLSLGVRDVKRDN